MISNLSHNWEGLPDLYALINQLLIIIWTYFKITQKAILYTQINTMKYLLLLSTLLICSSQITAQSFSSQDPAYIDNVKAGEAKLNTLEYDSCVNYYTIAFEVKQTSYLSLMRGGACAYSSDQGDIMEKWMDKAFENSWGGAKQVFDNYPEFEYLRDSKFAEIIDSKYNMAAEAAGVNL